MTYYIRKTDGSILTTLTEKELDEQYSMYLIGYPDSVMNNSNNNDVRYHDAEIINGNFIRLLENSANNTAPDNPIEGQLWYDKTLKSLKFWNGSSWTEIPASNVGYANSSLDNLNDDGKNIANWSSNITNCITEIPQDIKLELNNGTLTLKAGSKVYVPNGAGVFDVVTITNDITTTGVSFTGDCFYFVGGNGTYLTPRAINQCATFTTIPTSAISGVYEGYCSEDNKMYLWNNNTMTWEALGRSLPIGIVNFNSTSPYVREIVQVFNGFGYIGKNNFILPNVKFSISKEYNTDGSFKNLEYTITNVIVSSNYFDNNTIMFWRYNNGVQQVYNASISSYLGELSDTPSIGSGFQYYFNIASRLWYMHEAGETIWRQVDYINLGVNTSTKTNFREVFRAVDANEADFVIKYQRPTADNNYTWYRIYKSGWVEQGGETSGEPQSTRVNITLPITMKNSEYYANIISTAAENGYVFRVENRSTTNFWIAADYFVETVNPTSKKLWEVKGMSAI